MVLAHHVRKKMRFSASLLRVHLSVFDNWMWHCVHRCCGWLWHRCCGANCQTLTNCVASVHGCVGGSGVLARWRWGVLHLLVWVAVDRWGASAYVCGVGVLLGLILGRLVVCVCYCVGIQH